jgi:hypothetical protein
LPTRIFTVPDFDRFARKAKIDDAALVEVIERAERGIVDADLGGGLVKLRVPRAGQGRSGGFRTIVALVVGTRAFFLFGYAKNDSPNIADTTEESLKITAADLQKSTDAEIVALMASGRFREIKRP